MEIVNKRKKSTSRSQSFFVSLPLNETNRVLSIANNQLSGWQKDVQCSISFVNRASIEQLHFDPDSKIDSNLAVFLWLAYNDAPYYRLECLQHGVPLHDGRIRQDKVYYNNVFEFSFNRFSSDSTVPQSVLRSIDRCV
jgi:hypothetical protein